MTRRARYIGVAICLVAATRWAAAQQVDGPVRPLGPVVATAMEVFGNDALIRPFNDGRVLVNDPRNRRIVLFDSTLQQMVVVADTTSQTARAYGRGLLGLVPFRGDSSIVTDLTTGAFLVLDRTGRVARVIPFDPRSGSAMFGLTNAGTGFDQDGHLWFRGRPPVFLSLLDDDFFGDTLMVGPDSLPILRADLATGHVDTVAMLKAARIRQAVSRRARGSGSGRSAFNPIPVGDDWTVLNDGTLAIVRVDHYRVDRVGRDGRLTPGSIIPVPLVRITDSMKVALINMLRGANPGTEANGNRPAGAPPPAFVEPSDLPDYQPHFSGGSARADVEGNVWVRVNQATPTPTPTPTPEPNAGGVVYDVIDRRGVLADRVQIPKGSRIVGFGPGVAYLLSNTNAGVRIEKARIH